MRSKSHHSSCASVRRGKRKLVIVTAVLLILAACALPCGRSQQNQAGQNQPQQNPAALVGPAPSAPSAAAGGVQVERMGSDSAALLKLANELKAEVDKSTKDTLSLAVIRKAEEIERMAHGMKDRYRASVAAN